MSIGNSTTSPGLELKITSDPASLQQVRHALERFCADHGFDDSECDEIGLCFNEAVANIIRHAYDGAKDKPIDVQTRVAGDGLTLVIRDWGNGELPPSRPKPKLDLLEPGGLGLICLQQMMDEVRYDPQDKGMLLTLVKRKRKP